VEDFEDSPRQHVDKGSGTYIKSCPKCGDRWFATKGDPHSRRSGRHILDLAAKDDTRSHLRKTPPANYANTTHYWALFA